MVKSWIAISQSNPHSISLILSQSLWYNSFIKIDYKPLSPSFLCLKQPLFLKDIFDTNGAFLAWDAFAHKFNLTQNFYFKWLQIKSSIPRSWIKIISDNKTSDICHLSPHLNSGERINCIKNWLRLNFINFSLKINVSLRHLLHLMKIDFDNVLIGKKYTCSLAIHASIHLLAFFNSKFCTISFF